MSPTLTSVLFDIMTLLYAAFAALLALYAIGGCALLILSILPKPNLLNGDSNPRLERTKSAKADSDNRSAESTSVDLSVSSQRFESLAAQYPIVAVQLPIYNEPLVVERLIDAAANLDYPRERLIIQVLDDSTDETASLAAARVAVWQADGVEITHVRRESRAGYKAGALKYGLSLIADRAAYVAIFDADFVPPSDFLRHVIPLLEASPHAAALQTRWGHLNADDNALTRAQALALDAHFGVEQIGRARGGLLTNFSGSGGVWRITAIQTAGGWSDSTLTEDLDLSYRAQLCGWHILYQPEIVVPGEIPVDLAAYKVQQGRWARGNTRCLIQLAPSLWRAKGVSLTQKIMGTLHLCQYLTAPLMISLLLLTPPLLLTGNLKDVSALGALGVFGFGTILTPLIAAWRTRIDGRAYTFRQARDAFISIVLAFPALVALGTGMAWSNSVAVLNELAGQRIAFHRTPKTATVSKNGIEGFADSVLPSKRRVFSARLPAFQFPQVVAELVLAGYALWGVTLALRYSRGFAPYLAIYAVGFAVVALWQMNERTAR